MLLLMSQALTHFAIGAAGTKTVFSLLRRHVPFDRTLVLLGGVWAMVPDVYRVVPNYAEPIKEMHSTTFMNLFWFHRRLDVADPSDSNIAAALAVLLWISLTVTIEVAGAVWGLWG